MKLVNYFYLCILWQFLLHVCFSSLWVFTAFLMLALGIVDFPETQHPELCHQPFLHMFWFPTPSPHSFWWLKKCSSQAMCTPASLISQSFIAKTSHLVMLSALPLFSSPNSLDFLIMHYPQNDQLISTRTAICKKQSRVYWNFRQAELKFGEGKLCSSWNMSLLKSTLCKTVGMSISTSLLRLSSLKIVSLRGNKRRKSSGVIFLE